MPSSGCGPHTRCDAWETDATEESRALRPFCRRILQSARAFERATCCHIRVRVLQHFGPGAREIQPQAYRLYAIAKAIDERGNPVPSVHHRMPITGPASRPHQQRERAHLIPAVGQERPRLVQQFRNPVVTVLAPAFQLDHGDIQQHASPARVFRAVLTEHSGRAVLGRLAVTLPHGHAKQPGHGPAARFGEAPPLRVAQRHSVGAARVAELPHVLTQLSHPDEGGAIRDPVLASACECVCPAQPLFREAVVAQLRRQLPDRQRGRRGRGRDGGRELGVGQCCSGCALSTGYLAEAEAAFQRGELADYYLFPRGKLKGGCVPPRRAAAAHASYQAMRDLFEDLERIAGVEHRHGRSFYGLRRPATDLAAEFAQDARVLNSISGHADSATREQVYQDKENERVRAQAAEVRRSMRRYLLEGADGEQIAA